VCSELESRKGTAKMQSYEDVDRYFSFGICLNGNCSYAKYLDTEAIRPDDSGRSNTHSLQLTVGTVPR